jgi:hypothetical protein
MRAFPKERSVGLDKVADVTGQIRQYTLQQQTSSEGRFVAENLSSLLQEVAGNSLRDIDALILELQQMRTRLEQENLRVQQEMAAYSALAESAVQSTKVIFETLRNAFPRRTAR